MIKNIIKLKKIYIIISFLLLVGCSNSNIEINKIDDEVTSQEKRPITQEEFDEAFGTIKNYDEISEDPNGYIAKTVDFTGDIVKVELVNVVNNIYDIHLLLAIDGEDSKPLFVYQSNTKFNEYDFSEGDTVNIRGICEGTMKFGFGIGKTFTPSVNANTINKIV